MKRLVILLILATFLPSGDISNEVQPVVEHTITVDGTNLRFYPQSITINEGDSVRFLWGGELLPHNSVEENGVFNSGEPEREVDYLYTFDFNQSGEYNFFCEPHQAVGMDGVITVLDVSKENTEILVMADEGNNGLNIWIIVGGLLFLVIGTWFRTRIDYPSQIEDGSINAILLDGQTIE